MLTHSSQLEARWPLDRRAPVSSVAVSHWPYLFVVALALLVRLAVLWASADLGTQIVDEQHYHALATSLVQGDGYGWGPGQPTSIRPPLYPALIATIWYVVGSNSLQAVRVVQVALGLCSVTLIYLLGTRLFNRRVGVLAAVILALYPSFLFFGALLLTEITFTTLLLSALYACSVLLDRGTWWVACLTGGAIGFAALTRSILWPFPFVLVLFLAIALRTSMRDRIRLCALVLASYAIVVGPWVVRNSLLQRTFSTIDTMGGLNLLMGNYEYTPEDRMWDAIAMSGEKSWDEPLRHIAPPPGGWTEGLKEHWAQQRAVAFMLANPITTARRSILKFADLWGLEREWIAGIQQGMYHPSLPVAAASTVAILTSYPAVLLLGVTGLWLTPSADRRTQWLLLLVVAFVTALHSLTFGHSRYHLPLMPLFMVYAAAVLDQWHSVWPRLRTRAAFAPAGFVLMAMVIWSHEIFFRDFDRLTSIARRLGIPV